MNRLLKEAQEPKPRPPDEKPPAEKPPQLNQQGTQGIKPNKITIGKPNLIGGVPSDVWKTFATHLEEASKDFSTTATAPVSTNELLDEALSRMLKADPTLVSHVRLIKNSPYIYQLLNIHGKSVNQRFWDLESKIRSGDYEKELIAKGINPIDAGIQALNAFKAIHGSTHKFVNEEEFRDWAAKRGNLPISFAEFYKEKLAERDKEFKAQLPEAVAKARSEIEALQKERAEEAKKRQQQLQEIHERRIYGYPRSPTYEKFMERSQRALSEESRRRFEEVERIRSGQAFKEELERRKQDSINRALASLSPHQLEVINAWKEQTGMDPFYDIMDYVNRGFLPEQAAKIIWARRNIDLEKYKIYNALTRKENYPYIYQYYNYLNDKKRQLDQYLLGRTAIPPRMDFTDWKDYYKRWAIPRIRAALPNYTLDEIENIYKLISKQDPKIQHEFMSILNIENRLARGDQLIKLLDRILPPKE